MGLQWRDVGSPELKLQQPGSRQQYVHGKHAQCHKKAFVTPPIFRNYTSFLQAQGVKFPDGGGSFSQGSERTQNGEFSAILQSQVV